MVKDLNTKPNSIWMRVSSPFRYIFRSIYSLKGRYMRSKEYVNNTYKITRLKFLRWYKSDNITDRLAYLKSLSLIHLLYGVLLSFVVWYLFDRVPSILGVISLAIIAYIIKVETPSIIRDSRR